MTDMDNRLELKGTIQILTRKPEVLSILARSLQKIQ